MNKVEIVECGPRDGWQNLKKIVPLELKLELIDGIAAAGVSSIEITSFVSPKAIPQMADAAQVAAYCTKKHSNLKLYALVPNLRGAQLAWEAGIRNITYVFSLSESHSKANVNRTHEQALSELSGIIEMYPDLKISIGYATAFGCPYEGVPSIKKVLQYANKLYSLGVRSICLSDTIGIADPRQVRETISAMQSEFPDCELQVHIHDTRGMGLVNTLAAIELGVTTVQSTLGGLGGCPFAPGASGNVATEDLVYMLNRMGYDTGIDFDALLSVSRHQKALVEGIYSGHHINIGSDCTCY